MTRDELTDSEYELLYDIEEDIISGHMTYEYALKGAREGDVPESVIKEIINGNRIISESLSGKRITFRDFWHSIITRTRQDRI